MFLMKAKTKTADKEEMINTLPTRKSTRRKSMQYLFNIINNIYVK